MAHLDILNWIYFSAPDTCSLKHEGGEKKHFYVCELLKKKKKRLVILVISSHQATGNASWLPALLQLALQFKINKKLLYNVKRYTHTYVSLLFYFESFKTGCTCAAGKRCQKI